jgi:hypothetical protein
MVRSLIAKVGGMQTVHPPRLRFSRFILEGHLPTSVIETEEFVAD